MAYEYNPLDYGNLTRNCVDELMKRGPFALPPFESFPGAGVYALFYKGPLSLYAPIVSPDVKTPIYVGKAIPPGGRKGGGAQSSSASPLFNRLREHAASIEATDLGLDSFVCRYLVVTPLWITMAERFLIEHYQPLWNVALDGFGLHDPGSGRHQGEIPWWDALHSGRAWATKLRQTRTRAQAEAVVEGFFESQRVDPEVIERKAAEVAAADPERDETA
jgi:hypothetical protein